MEIEFGLSLADHMELSYRIDCVAMLSIFLIAKDKYLHNFFGAMFVYVLCQLLRKSNAFIK